MASTATTSLGLEKQGTGENNNLWGGKLNTGVFDLVDEAVAGVVAFSLSGSKTLTSTNYVSNEARKAAINVTGGTGGTVTIPAVSKVYLVRNNASSDVTISNGSNSLVIKSGNTEAVFTDGTNIYRERTLDYGSDLLSSSGTPTDGSHLVNKTAMDAAIAAAALGSISTVPVSQGGTGLASYTAGDLIYASGSTTLTKLAAASTGNVLLSGTSPSWGKVGLTTHVSGTLPVANGGTGVTTSTGSGSNVLSTSPTLTTPTLTNAIVGTQSPGDNSTKAASTAYADAAVAAFTSPWTQVATSTPTGTGAVEFTGLHLLDWNDYLIVFDAVSHNNGSSQTITIAVANVGSFGSGVTASNSIAAAASWSGAVYLPGFKHAAGMWVAGLLSSTTTTVSSGWASPSARSQGIRVATSAGNFDAGTITLYGKK